MILQDTSQIYMWNENKYKKKPCRRIETNIQSMHDKQYYEIQSPYYQTAQYILFFISTWSKST